MGYGFPLNFPHPFVSLYRIRRRPICPHVRATPFFYRVFLECLTKYR